MTLQTDSIFSVSPVAGRKMTFDEFLATEFDSDHYEWVDGEAVELAPVQQEHALIHAFLFSLLNIYVEAKDGGAVLSEPWLIRPSSALPARSPDIQVVLKANLSRLQPMHTEGAADVVIEIVSPKSRKTDRVIKFQEYARGGVPEYWLIDPLRKQAEFFVLSDGRFVPADLDEQTGRFISKSLSGFFLDVQWLWTRPPNRELLKLLGVE